MISVILCCLLICIALFCISYHKNKRIDNEKKKQHREIQEMPDNVNTLGGPPIAIASNDQMMIVQLPNGQFVNAKPLNNGNTDNKTSEGQQPSYTLQ